MKTILLKISLIMCLLTINSYCQSYVHSQSTTNLSSLIMEIDNSCNNQKLFDSLDDKAIIYLPDTYPIYTKGSIVDLFITLWENRKNGTEVEYHTMTIEVVGDTISESGVYNNYVNNNLTQEYSYNIVGIHKDNNFRILEIDFGDSKKDKIDELPKPNGEYFVGQLTYYDNNSVNRPIAYQIWYPSLLKGNSKIVYQSSEIAYSISQFLGWPSYSNSFTSLIKSNSYRNVPIVGDKIFPVIIYNHGYGGFTSVYQTIFEELASNGYIVVSIGHKDESAMLIRDDGTVLSNSPDNPFYSKRTSELTNDELSIHQDVILNSDNYDSLLISYKNHYRLTPLHNKSVKLWIQDTKNILKELKHLNKNSTLLKGGFDFKNMGIFGHSLGGAVAGDLSTGNIFKAGINLDGFQFGNLINSKLEIPFLFVSSNPRQNNYLRILPFAQSSQKEVYHIVINGFNHGSFSDLQLFTENGYSGIKLQRDMVLLFFNQYLKNNDTTIDSLMDRYGNISIKKYN